MQHTAIPLPFSGPGLQSGFHPPGKSMEELSEGIWLTQEESSRNADQCLTANLALSLETESLTVDEHDDSLSRQHSRSS